MCSFSRTTPALSTTSDPIGRLASALTPGLPSLRHFGASTVPSNERSKQLALLYAASDLYVHSARRLHITRLMHSAPRPLTHSWRIRKCQAFSAAAQDSSKPSSPRPTPSLSHSQRSPQTISNGTLVLAASDI